LSFGRTDECWKHLLLLECANLTKSWCDLLRYWKGMQNKVFLIPSQPKTQLCMRVSLKHCWAVLYLFIYYYHPVLGFFFGGNLWRTNGFFLLNDFFSKNLAGKLNNNKNTGANWPSLYLLSAFLWCHLSIEHKTKKSQHTTKKRESLNTHTQSIIVNGTTLIIYWAS
jgi:hypothetical protein